MLEIWTRLGAYCPGREHPTLWLRPRSVLSRVADKGVQAAFWTELTSGLSPDTSEVIHLDRGAEPAWVRAP